MRFLKIKFLSKKKTKIINTAKILILYKKILKYKCLNFIEDICNAKFSII